jgi:hypothetical protein
MNWTWMGRHGIPSGKRLHNYGTSQFLMGKCNKWAIFNSYAKLSNGKNHGQFMTIGDSTGFSWDF